MLPTPMIRIREIDHLVLRVAVLEPMLRFKWSRRQLWLLRAGPVRGWPAACAGPVPTARRLLHTCPRRGLRPSVSSIFHRGAA